MPDLLPLTLLFLAGAVAGVLNVMAGGGSLLTLPALMFFGLPASVANGTNRLAILAQNVVAVAGFRRGGHSDPRTGLALAAFTLPGAVAGAFISLEIPELWFKRILALIIVGGVITLLVRRPAGEPANARTPRIGWRVALAFLAIGFYGGFIQAGIGMVFLLVLYHLLHVGLVWVNAYKVFVVGVYTLPALGVFIWTGNVDWRAGGVLALGNATGAVLGTRVSLRGGDRPIRVVVAVALLLMAVRLFTGG